MRLAINVATVEVIKCATLSMSYTATSYDYSYSNYVHTYVAAIFLYYNIMCLGKSPAVWRNIAKGRHTITIRAFCINNESIVTRRRKKFKFHVC